MIDWSELTDLPEYLQIFAGLFALTPPSIMIPFFLGVVGGRAKSDMRKVALYASIGFMLISTMFVLLGNTILNAFSISTDTFQIAGGILLVMIALDLLGSNGSAEQAGAQQVGSILSISIVPMTIPAMAGPGVLSTVVVYSNQHAGITHKLVVIIVIALVALANYAVLRGAEALERFFTPSVQLAFNKIMGLIIMAVAVEFILHGLGGHIPSLGITH